jgi:bifunctional non-homologous end joining protein LigD
MLAVPGEELPSGPFGYEIAWSGERALTFVSGGRVDVRGGLLTRFPELRALGPALGVTEPVLDGELIVLGDGRPSAELLSERLAVRSDSTARRLANRHPATLMIYDLLWLDGHATMPLGYAERRRLLEGLKLGGPAWQVPASHVGEEVGAALLEAARQQGLSGVIAKRLDRAYRGGRAEGDWIFVPA